MSDAVRPLNQQQTQLQSLRSIEVDLKNTKQALRARNTELFDMKEDLAFQKQESLNAKSMLGDQNAKYDHDINQWVLKYDTLKHEHCTALDAEQERFRDEKEQQRDWYEGRIRTARYQEASRQEQKIATLQKQLSVERWQWHAHVNSLTGIHESRLKEAQVASEKRAAELKGESEHQIGLERAKYDKMTKELNAQLSQLKVDMEEEKSQLRKDVQAEQMKVQDERKRRKKELDKQEIIFNQKHANELSEVRSANEALKQGLFQRKHFKGLRDRDLAGDFSTIVGQVRDFANLDWDRGRDSEWPFAERELLEIHGSNIRKLKKQILQNSIWVLLYTHIFCTPFCILGREGHDLDHDWIQIHTPGKFSSASRRESPN